MTILDGIPRGKFADVSSKNGYEFIDNGDTFVLAQYPETGIHQTTVWNPKEWEAYIVNDNGKTIDKIAS